MRRATSARPRSTPSEEPAPVLLADWCSADDSDCSTPRSATCGTSARAAAAEAFDDRLEVADEPVAVACQGATWARAGRAAPGGRRGPPRGPGRAWDPRGAGDGPPASTDSS